jgi:hypothetical protein
MRPIKAQIKAQIKAKTRVPAASMSGIETLEVLCTGGEVLTCFFMLLPRHGRSK